MGVKAIAKHLNERKLYTRTGGRWGVGAVHRMLTRTSYIGVHEFNRRTKHGAHKPDDQVIAVPVPRLIDQATFEAVQASLKARNPKVTPPRWSAAQRCLPASAFARTAVGHDHPHRKVGALPLLHLLDRRPAGRDRLLDPSGWKRCWKSARPQNLLRTLVAAGGQSAGGVHSFVPKWRSGRLPHIFSKQLI
jgi:hypothetical protein